MKSRKCIDPRPGFAVLETTVDAFHQLPARVQNKLRAVHTDDLQAGSRVYIEMPLSRVREVLEIAARSGVENSADCRRNPEAAGSAAGPGPGPQKGGARR